MIRVGIFFALTVVGLASGADLGASSKEAIVVRDLQRHLTLQGTLNTRDLGGYRTHDGHTVRWGRLYRSDDLSHLNGDDWARLLALDLARITDLRSEDERRAAPYVIPEVGNAPTYRSISMVVPGTDVEMVISRIYSGNLSNDELLALSDRRSFVTSPVLRSRMGDWIRGLTEPGELPQLFHCTGGKDRTGIGAAFVLLALGVPREQIMEDFLLSNEYLKPRIERSIQQIASRAGESIDVLGLRSILGVRRQSLEQVFQVIDEKYGSADEFLTKGLGLDRVSLDRLRGLMLVAPL